MKKKKQKLKKIKSGISSQRSLKIKITSVAY